MIDVHHDLVAVPAAQRHRTGREVALRDLDERIGSAEAGDVRSGDRGDVGTPDRHGGGEALFEGVPLDEQDRHADHVGLVGARGLEHGEHIPHGLFGLRPDAAGDDRARGIRAVLPADLQQVEVASHQHALAVH